MSFRRRFGLRATGLGIAVAAAIIALPVSSWAHNAVLETTPEAGDTVTVSPVEVRIVTSDTLLDLGGQGSGFAIAVQDDQGAYFGDGCLDIGSTDYATVADLGQAGDYTVTYRFVSADGHSLSDSFSFTFEPTDDHTPADGFVNRPVCGEEGQVVVPETDTEEKLDEKSQTPAGEAPSVVVAEPSDGPADDGDGDNGTIIAAIVGVLIVLSITLIVWMVKRRNGA